MLLYIHIPFCDSKCHYCAFNSYVDKFELRSAYMQALCRQLRFELERFETKPKSVKTVFFGGGTPSTVAPELYESVFAIFSPYLCDNAEITSEANPNSATKEWLEGMKHLGVNRISFGVQSFDEKKLKLLGRAHNKTQAINAIQNAHEVGFSHISLDLIYAVAQDTKELLFNDLKQAFDLPIDHLSAYALTIEENTPFAKNGKIAKEQLDLTKAFFAQIEQNGFKQYEISNFGRYKSRHNLGYWRYEDYLGVGAGAVGKKQNRRFYPANDIEAYIANPLACTIETLTQEDMQFERIFLGLRSEVGVAKTLLNQAEREKAHILIKEGKLVDKNGRYFNIDYLLADEIAMFLSNN